MARCHLAAASCHLAAAAAAALILCLVGQVSAQVAVNVTAFGVTPLLVYGQPATYTINLATGPGLPSPNVGNAVIQNATNTPLISFPITAGSATSACTGAGCTLVVSFTDTGAASGVTYGGILPAGVYSALSAGYTGGTSSQGTFSPASSSQNGLPAGTFTVLPASTEFSTAFTPFTLANFSSAISVNITNLNKTSVVPAGTAYAAFYKDPAGANTLIGNYSLVFTPVDANTVKLTFPASFNAATLFTTPGPYRLIETYFPTPNFTQPTPLVIGFTVAPTTPSPPPPPSGVPAPPPPPSPTGTGSKTTISLSIFFTYARRRLLNYGGCNRSGSLTFVTAVKGPTSAQVPPDGTVTISLQPGNIAIGSAPVVPNAATGSATATIVRPFVDGSTYGYAAQTATAFYSGSTNGVYLPAQVTVAYAIPNNCQQNAKQDLVNHVVDSVHDIIGIEPSYGYGYPYAAQTGTFTAGK
ncbi:hypothetical protein WJX75_002972 [Coccomyxa subellipsoidea]|uniref:Extracellular protein n=1 Tax=Coccomyxa subellipsoidea TaxID=248742 RepID=A0ABR2YCC3_9CHLO